MKILYVSTLSLTINSFFKTHIRSFLAQGHSVEIACNCNDEPIHDFFVSLGCKIHNIPFSRSPFAKKNLAAYKQLKRLVHENQYDIVHCHTPNAAAITRFACKGIRKAGTKVFYTAHGFHFFEGAPLKNWILYFPIEWLCAHWTDVLITINREDYHLAQRKMKAKKVVYVPGVGIDVNEFNKIDVDKAAKRILLGVPENAVLLLSIGELNDNKNHETVLRAIAGMDVYYMIAGVGDKEQRLKDIAAEVGMADRLKLLGYRTDVEELYAASDVFVFPSFREGLSVSLMEAMASGLPCAVSKIRGNTDLIDENGGALFNPADVGDAKKQILKLLQMNKADRDARGFYNSNRIKAFDQERIVCAINDLYKEAAR